MYSKANLVYLYLQIGVSALAKGNTFILTPYRILEWFCVCFLYVCVLVMLAADNSRILEKLHSKSNKK